jgi:hypothetical protein
MSGGMLYVIQWDLPFQLFCHLLMPPLMARMKRAMTGRGGKFAEG